MASGMALLSLDYDRIISQWGDSSVFACDAGDALGDLLQHLEDDDSDTQAWLECQDESTDQHYGAASTHGAPCLGQQASIEQKPTAVPMGKSGSNLCQQQFSGSAAAAGPAFEAVPLSMQQQWWDCPPASAGAADMPFIKDEPGRTSFDASFSPFSPTLSAGRQASEPCIVPDTAVPPPPPLAGSSFGLVPQMLPSQPGFMCMPPMPMPPMMAMPPTPAPMPVPTPAPAPDNEMQRLRQECLKRYREKKARRMYTKMVRYQLRKINADKRPRIKGRFVKKTEEELATAVAAGSAARKAAARAASKDASESTTAMDDCLSDISL